MSNPQTVTRLRATETTDRYGDTVSDWGTPDSLDIDACSIAPLVADEDNEFGRQGVPIGWTLYRRSPADIQAHDRIVAGGVTYEVDGFPAGWSSMYSAFEGVAVTLRRFEG